MELDAKYTKKIEYYIALYNESYMASEYENMDIATKYQYDKLNSKNYYYQVGKLLIMNGNNESETDYSNNARAKKIKVTVNDDKEYTFDLKTRNNRKTS